MMAKLNHIYEYTTKYTKYIYSWYSCLLIDTFSGHKIISRI